MDWDEVRPQPAKVVTVGESLEALSLGELRARIAALEGEIARVTAEIERKQKHEAAAAAIFKR